jgi:hypothetical protein
MSHRNRHLRIEALRANPNRTPADSAIAACLLMAMSDKQIVAATGLTRGAVIKRIQVMRRNTGTPNRVGLALALRELI